MREVHYSGPWGAVEIADYLKKTFVPMKLAAVSESGWPVLVSLWFYFESGCLICASRSHSRIISLLSKDCRCAFEVSGDTPPYSGVRGQGDVSLYNDPTGRILGRLHDRFLGAENTQFRRWLLDGADKEVIIFIKPVRLMSWDYTSRMSVSTTDNMAQ
ncbi:MAG: pyridoxamine 5'-phosphate oxidase [Rhodospirillaceae bacterium]|nr:pyridoxamine 5'-phosphate oxidase [Rhodospirillaceae bacterium]|tara:strand:- start:1706 stop:2179 length:474 start_codon:yes stop_codon:yes gene_type:complete